MVALDEKSEESEDNKSLQRPQVSLHQVLLVETFHFKPQMTTS